MNNKEIEVLIKNLGSTYQLLTSKKILNDRELVCLYEDTDTLEFELTPYIELVFWAESLKLEMIIFKISAARAIPQSKLQSSLPDRLGLINNQADVHRELGQPIFSKTPMQLYGTEFYAWDTYQLDQILHTEAVIDIQYDNKLSISNIIVSLIDKHV